MDASNELYKTDEFRMAYMKVRCDCVDVLALSKATPRTRADSAEWMIRRLCHLPVVCR